MALNSDRLSDHLAIFGLELSTNSSRLWIELFLDLKPVYYAMKIDKIN